MCEWGQEEPGVRGTYSKALDASLVVEGREGWAGRPIYSE
jgi:hypothetical protein